VKSNAHILAMGLLAAGIAAHGSGLEPAELRCDGRTDALGVDSPQPTLSWIVSGSQRGGRQSAYQVVVTASAPGSSNSQRDLWDSGKVAGEDSLHTAYHGKTLSDSQKVFWRVRVWDDRDRVSAWSPPGSWTMGLSAWTASWICAPGETETLLLRKQFVVRAGLTRALVHLSGLGQYELVVNGKKAGQDVLSPGWTDYHKTILYDTKEITPELRQGPNVIGIVLGNGMYRVVRRNRFVKFTGYMGPLRAILQLRLEYADGSAEVVGTDESWRCHPGPITFSNIYGGEDYDARLNPSGWDRPGFDDHAWPKAVAIVRPAGKLLGLSTAADPLREIQTLPAKLATRFNTSGETLYDLGQNAPCMPRFVVSGPAGSSVRLTPGEILGPDGRIDRGTMGGTSRGSSWWTYTKGTDQAEEWTPQFCYIGCRYLQARCEPAAPGGALPRIEHLEGRVVHSTAAPIGTFSCSNERLNRIRNLVRWAQRANMVSVLTDCPHREKLGWLEQYHLNGPSLRYEFDVRHLFIKGMHDMADAQLENGLIPNIAPEYTEFKGTFRAAAEWGSAFIIVPWQHYQFTGDDGLLRTYYAPMKRYLAYLSSRATNDIVSEGLGDWYDLGPGKPGFAQLTHSPVTATAFYYYDAWILAETARLLNKPDEQRAFAAQAERIRANYNAAFFHADSGSYATGSQCANALPLVLGIAEPQHRAAVFASLVRDVEAHDCSMTAGDVGFRFLLQALAQGGRSDLVYRMIDQDDKPGYGYQLKKGETSLTEAWDANSSSSHNHFMLGHIIEWFYKDLAGIRTDPEHAGFKTVVINPSPVGDLKWVEASYQSVRGPISVRWDRTGSQFKLHVNIPANTTGKVFVPGAKGKQVHEGGIAAEKSPGVRLVGMQAGRTQYEIMSGDYVFEAEL
jgi:alpha-L-rhamnosidase